ncbi:MAG: T9SS type A sorting domain-containing protein [Ignavibacteria bacterium]|nr:T9SS type A sorting domain-containing protein [Ignavibacteria bacterium]
MKQFFSVLFLFVFVSGLSLAQDSAQELAPKSQGPAIINGNGGTPLWEAPGAVLFDNGPLVNDPGGGFGGADRSFIESALGHTLYGWGHQVLNDNAMADQFTIPAGEQWQIDELMTFAYQTGAPTTSTITEVRAQIWDGDPMTTGTVIWGDHTTNIMTNTIWSNIYRTTETDPMASNRAIMVQTSTIGTTLSEGTYWVHWQSNGTLTSGPWCPPVTELGVAVTGDALQSIAGVFQPALNGTQPNGAPFILMGSVVGGGTTFTDNFDSYVAGQQLACQNPTDWTTWPPALPCDLVVDPYISTNYAYSGANSCVIVQNNDLVRLHGSLTTGQWYMSFLFYIPTGNAGYFNQMSGFAPNPNQWAVECYFDVGGGGRLLADVTTNFTWVENTWNQVVLIVDLDSPASPAEFWIGTNPSNLTMVATWDWTRGGTITNRIDANDFFGATATDEMYMDNYYFGDAMPPIIPVELTSFTGNVNNLGQVVLNWQTATELNNQGFEIERRMESSEFRTIGFVEGAGTVTETRNYSFIDKTADQGINYYRLKQMDFNGTYAYSDEVEVDVTAPLTFDLAQNYPNPFNPSTNIKFSVPESGNVKLSVYNLVGEEVAVLVNGFSQAGTFEVTFDASNLSSGVYLYKLQSANSVQTKKMMLLK